MLFGIDDCWFRVIGRLMSVRLMVEFDVEDEEQKEERLGAMLAFERRGGDKGYKR